MKNLIRLSLIILMGLNIISTSAYASGPVEEEIGSALTKDPLSLVFMHLDVISASKVRVVCKDWQRVANSLNLSNNPYFITTAQLHLYFSEGPRAEFDLQRLVQPKNLEQLDERLIAYIQLLLKERVLQDFRHVGFQRIINACSCRAITNHDRATIDRYCGLKLGERKRAIDSWPNSLEKANQLRVLAGFSDNVTDVESAYVLYRDFNAPDSEQVLSEFVNHTMPYSLFKIEGQPQNFDLERTIRILNERVAEARRIRADYERRKINYIDRAQMGEELVPVQQGTWSSLLTLVLDIARVFLQ